MSSEQDPALIAVEIRNFRGCRFVRIDFNEVVTLLGGKNGAGKTSVLEGIRALGSDNRALPAYPIHDDATSARLFMDLGTMTIEKVISEGSKPKTIVKDLAGNKVTASQVELAEMFDSLAFDPSEFVTMKQERQDEELRAAIGLDLSDVETEHKRVYDERTAVNREVKSLEGRLTEKVHFPDAPAEETTTAAALAELEKHDKWANQVNSLATAVKGAGATEAEKLRALEAAKAEYAAAAEALRTAQLALERAPARPTAPRDELKTKLDGLDEANRKVRSNKERATISSELQAKKAESAAKTERLDALDALKAERIANAKFPIDGLAFDAELGPTFNGHPLKQCGESELWLLSCALCMARDPKLKAILIRRGSQLDDEALAKLYALAKEKKFKILVEVVTRKPEDEKGVDVMMRNGTGERVQP